MSDKTKTTCNGIGFGGALFLIFMTLKLCGKIAWSWWWVTSPLWIPLAFVSAIIIVVLIVGLIVSIGS